MRVTGLTTDRQAPIGVLDSGLGGLSVVGAIAARLPHEDLVYLGDTARFPYGGRSAQAVLHYARGCARKLLEHQVKLLLVACNTVSAVALDLLAVELDIPVLGVIGPGARAAVRHSAGGPIGVIATAATVDSGAYARAFAAADASVQVRTEAAPLLVALAEQGWIEGDLPRLCVRRYLQPLTQSGIETLLLGCTHYPLLKPAIALELTELAGRPIPIVDSAGAAADELAVLLSRRAIRAERSEPGRVRLLVTDLPRRCGEVAARFLGGELAELQLEPIDL